eukprot:3420579-Rhodomonas_salina.2
MPTLGLATSLARNSLAWPNSASEGEAIGSDGMMGEAVSLHRRRSGHGCSDREEDCQRFGLWARTGQVLERRLWAPLPVLPRTFVGILGGTHGHWHCGSGSGHSQKARRQPSRATPL